MNKTHSSTPHVTSRTSAAPHRPMPDQHDDATSPPDNRNNRALVLAGGGAAGNAWEIGVIAGLFDAGVDVATADLIVGTSAGSTAAAQITSGIAVPELYAAIVAEAPRQQAGDAGSDRGRAPSTSAARYIEWSNDIIASSRDASDMRRRIGAAALEMDAESGFDGSRWRDIVAARIGMKDWPEQRVLITAVDARTGEPVVFDRYGGIELVDAVAASTSPLTPYPIGDNRYIDGGYRRNENADLAAGYGHVLVLAPFGGRSRMRPEWGMDLATQVDELLAAGSTVATVFPDGRSGDAFDARAVDPSTRPQAASGGFDQGRALAHTLSEAWRETEPEDF